MTVQLRKFCSFVLLMLVAFAACSEGIPSLSADQAARAIVELYCKTEFEGSPSPERGDYSLMSEKYQAKQWDQGNEMRGSSIDWGWDPEFVVASYEILNVTVDGDAGHANISYIQLAKGSKDTFTAAPIDRDIVTLNLKLVGTNWKVVDPPPPRISRDALLRSYSLLAKDSVTNLKRSDISKEQRQALMKYGLNVDFLKNLPIK